MIKTQISLNEMKKIFSEYSIGIPHKIRKLTRGATNTNYKVETSKGIYVFRLYEKYQNNRIKFEEEVLGLLKRIRSIPTAHVVYRKNGSAFGQYNGKFFAIFNFINGNHAKTASWPYIAEITRMIALLNKKTIGHRFVYKKSVEECCPKEYWKIAVKNAKQITDNTLRQQRLDWTQKKLADIKLPHTLPKCLCHMDGHINNALFDNNKKCVGLLDFDMASYSCAICDLACVIYRFAREPKKELEFELAQKIIKEYEKIRPLTKLEKVHLFDAIKMVEMTGGCWFIG